MTLDLNNTEIAFQTRSDPALRAARRLFRLIGSRWLVTLGTFLVRAALKLGLPIEGLIRRTLFRQFCGGETATACLPLIEELGRSRIGTILDFAMEATEDERTFDAVAQEIRGVISLAQRDPRIPFAVFKVTGVASFDLLARLHADQPLSPKEKKEWEKARGRVTSICRDAHDKGVRVFIDAEESWIQRPIDGLVTEMMALYNRERAIVYNTVQLYRTDRLSSLQSFLEGAQKGGYFLGFKIVRGAYMEKERHHAQSLGLPSPVFSDKASTDKAYDEALRWSIEHTDRVSICAGTHNEASTLLLCDLMNARGIEPSNPKIYFSQLLGMSDHLSFNLAAEGYNVAKYVPYGPVRAVVPYLTRRAEENTSIQGQTGRELSLIEQELQRRLSRGRRSE